MSKGFTLVEILIAITIFAFVSLFTANSIRNAVRSRSKINTQIENSSELRDALKVIEADVNKAFNYHDYHVDLYNLAQKERAERKKKKNPPKKPKTEGQDDSAVPPPVPTPPVDPEAGKPKEEIPQRKTPPNYTHFKGTKEEMNFTTLNNVQIRAKIPVSDQAEVGYFLKNCRNRINKEIRSNCLWRRVDPYLDKEIKTGGTSSVLIENVEEFELSYIGPEKNSGEWTDIWDSQDNFTAKTKNKFPSAVKIKLKVKTGFEKKDRSLEMTVVAPIFFTNNDIEDINKKSTANDK